MAPSFVSAVKSAISFLEEDYGFEIVSSFEDPKRSLYADYVQYQSPSTIVSFAADRGIISSPYILRSVDLSPRGIFWSHGLFLDSIAEFSVASVAERELLISASPDDDRAIGRTLQNVRARFRHPPYWEIEGGNEQGIRTALEYEALTLAKYAAPFLAGDFTNWPTLHEYSNARVVAEHIRFSRLRRGAIPEGELENELKIIRRRSEEYVQRLREE